jgi:hypothetical protein
MSFLVSILIRTKGDREKYFNQALKSALSQDWRPLEIIVVEDGGRVHADAVSKLDCPEGVSVTHIESAGGRCAVGNEAIRSSSGRFVCFLDDDDWLDDCHVSVLCQAIADNANTVAAYSLARQVAVSESGGEREIGVFGTVPFSFARLCVSNLFAIQSVLASRAAVERVGSLDENLSALEDWDLWLRLAAEGPFVGVDRATSSFRTPASWRERKRREQSHRTALRKLLEKHNALSVPVSFAEIRQLETDIRERLDEFLGVGWALQRIWRRIWRWR